MTHTARVQWPARQMYSPSHPIGRSQIFNAFATVLAAIVDALHGEPEKIREEEVPGCEYLGYDASRQTWRIEAGGAALIIALDPILASMGVSGENLSVHGEGLPPGVTLSGAALSSAREVSWASLTVTGLDEERGQWLLDTFQEAFPRAMSEEAIAAELARTFGR